MSIINKNLLLSTSANAITIIVLNNIIKPMRSKFSFKTCSFRVKLSFHFKRLKIKIEIKKMKMLVIIKVVRFPKKELLFIRINTNGTVEYEK